MKHARNEIPMVRNCEYCEETFKKESPPQIYCTMICRIFDSCERIPNGCWIWLKGKDKNGYGLMSVNNKSYRSSRITYETFIGYIPPGMLICHSCDNPSCINPEHLFLGSPKDNMTDMYQKNRDRNTGIKSVVSKLTEENVLEILKMRKNGDTLEKIAKKFNVTKQTIFSIVHKDNWKHITLEG